jgi:hypothetical protein
MLYTTQNGEVFNCTKEQGAMLKTLEQTTKGGFASLLNYTAKSKRVKPETANYTLLTRFNTKRLYARKVEALKNISFDDVKKLANDDSKLSALSYNDLFEAFGERKAWEVSRLEKSLAGVLSNSKTEAHQRNYISIGDGVKVNLVTEKIDGIQMPVLSTVGVPTVASVMLSGLTIKKDVVTAGEYKKVNSGIPVRISNCLNRLLNGRSVGLKTFSLNADNFERLRISHNEIIPENVKAVM